MSDPDIEIVLVPRQLYYHEVAYVRGLEAQLVEATAELIYLRENGHLGAKWWANESKDVWRDMARAALAKSSRAEKPE